MTRGIVHVSEPVTLVGGGPVDNSDVNQVLSIAPFLVAADGGADKSLAAGHVPRCVIGDFDSLTLATRRLLPTESLYHVSEQDSTDFEKALARIAAPLILGLGFVGGRVDHQLAALHGLMRFSHQRCILVSRDEIVLHGPPRLTFEIAPGAVVSLFPLAQVTGHSAGLRWPIAGIGFAPGSQIGTSNQAVAGQVTLRFDAPGMLLILPRATLQSVMRGLEHADARWPAPAK